MNGAPEGEGDSPVAAASGESGPTPAVAAGIGAVLLALAAAVLFDSQRLPPGAAAGVGPAAAMRVVAVVLAVLGLAHWVAAFRQRGAHPGAEPRNLGALAWVLGGLAGLMLAVQFGGGFMLASAWLFVFTARGFGAPLGVKSIGYGVGLAAAVYLFFTKVLSLGLPAGPLERLVA